MSHVRFTAALISGSIVALPFLVFGWIWVVAEVNFHDALAVTAVVAVWWQLRGLRREERAATRALRRLDSARAMRQHRAYVTGEDAPAYATGPVPDLPLADDEPVSWAA